MSLTPSRVYRAVGAEGCFGPRQIQAWAGLTSSATSLARRPRGLAPLPDLVHHPVDEAGADHEPCYLLWPYDGREGTRSAVVSLRAILVSVFFSRYANEARPWVSASERAARSPGRDRIRHQGARRRGPCCADGRQHHPGCGFPNRRHPGEGFRGPGDVGGSRGGGCHPRDPCDRVSWIRVPRRGVCAGAPGRADALDRGPARRDLELRVRAASGRRVDRSRT